MSKYTTELRYICEQYCIDHYPETYTEDNIDTFSPYDIATVVATDGYLTKYGTSDFSIYDETYRIPLMIKFIMHYYTREIGEETFGLWKMRVRSRFDMIMPYYNELYRSLLFEYNPLYTENLSTRTDGEKNSSGSSEDHISIVGAETNSGTNAKEGYNNVTTGNSDWNLYSDTPQGGIYGIQNAEETKPDPNLSDDSYLTNATHDIKSGTNNTNYRDDGTFSGRTDNTSNRNDYGSNTNHTTDAYITTVTGYRGYSSNKLIKEFRDNILNVDRDIIREFKKYFINLW